MAGVEFGVEVCGRDAVVANLPTWVATEGVGDGYVVVVVEVEDGCHGRVAECPP